MRFNFGKPGTPGQPLLVCPECLHVGAGRPKGAAKLECTWCHRVVVVFKETQR